MDVWSVNVPFEDFRDRMGYELFSDCFRSTIDEDGVSHAYYDEELDSKIFMDNLDVYDKHIFSRVVDDVVSKINEDVVTREEIQEEEIREMDKWVSGNFSIVQ